MPDIIFNALPLTEAQREAFRAAAPDAEHRFFPLLTRSGAALPLLNPAALAGATVILGCPDPELVTALDGLKWLQAWSAGVDPYLRPGRFPSGAMLTNSVGAYGPPVAEHMLASLLALMKNLPLYRDQQRLHRWEVRDGVRTLDGALVLVVGAGDIGSRFAGQCKALGAETVGLKRTVGAPIPGFDRVRPIGELDHGLPQADVVVLALPHSPETTHILDRRRLGLMKEGALLVNGGRGSAIDPGALLDALRDGPLRAAALDVTEPEPLPADSPLWDQENLLLTPHVAGGFHLPGTLDRVVDIALDNLRRYAAGQALRNRVR